MKSKQGFTKNIADEPLFCLNQRFLKKKNVNFGLTKLKQKFVIRKSNWCYERPQSPPALPPLDNDVWTNVFCKVKNKLIWMNVQDLSWLERELARNQTPLKYDEAVIVDENRYVVIKIMSIIHHTNVILMLIILWCACVDHWQTMKL